MHPASTRQEFLRLRVQGLSFARISRQLGVSKPTLIAWSRQSRKEIASRLVDVSPITPRTHPNPIEPKKIDFVRENSGQTSKQMVNFPIPGAGAEIGRASCKERV